MLKKVSVLIPLFNSESTILETVQSVLNQTYREIEIIVVDDGSTDNSLKVAESISDKRVRVIHQKNRGACAARNVAMEVSSGDFIQFLDADDLLSPNKIENQLKLIDKNGENTIISCRWEKFEDSIENAVSTPQLIDKSYTDPVLWLIDSWSGKGMAIPSIWLSSRTLLLSAGYWDESLTVNQDGEFFSRVLLHAEEIVFDHNSTVYYRVGNSNSISQRNKDSIKADSLLRSFKLYEKHTSHLIDRKGMRTALATNYAKYLYHYDRYEASLSEKAWSYLNNIRPHGEKVLYGGGRFLIVAKTLGFKNALKMIRFIHRFSQ